MTIAIHINCLEELDQIRDKEVLGHLVLRCVQSFHQVDKCWQLQTIGVLFELTLQDTHVVV